MWGGGGGVNDKCINQHNIMCNALSILSCSKKGEEGDHTQMYMQAHDACSWKTVNGLHVHGPPNLDPPPEAPTRACAYSLLAWGAVYTITPKIDSRPTHAHGN